MDVKKYIPALLIGGVALYLLYYLNKSKAPTQVINRAVPTATTTSIVDTRDPYRVAGFQQLASLAGLTQQGANQLQLAGLQVGAEQNRLAQGYQLESARLSNAFQIAQQGQETERQRIAAQTSIASGAQTAAIETARLGYAQRQYDVDAQMQAQQRALDAISRSQTQSQVGSLLGALLQGLFNRQQSGTTARSQPSGSSQPQQTQTRPTFRYPNIPRPNVGYQTPPFNPGYYNDYSPPSWLDAGYWQPTFPPTIETSGGSFPLGGESNLPVVTFDTGTFWDAGGSESWNDPFTAGEFGWFY